MDNNNLYQIGQMSEQQMGINPAIMQQPNVYTSTVMQTAPVNCDKVMQVTSITDLQKYSQGTIVRFPDFAEGQPFVARVRRPSMLVLAKSGKIPNSLMETATNLFNGNTTNKKSGEKPDEKFLEEILGICEIICEATLIEPTLKEIKGCGMELSDDQLMAIFNYTQVGVKALESFREEPKVIDNPEHVQRLQGEAKQNI